jgi:hypothetical protein
MTLGNSWYLKIHTKKIGCKEITGISGTRQIQNLEQDIEQDIEQDSGIPETKTNTETSRCRI